MGADAETPLLVEREGPRLRVTINRPAKANAINRAIVAAFEAPLRLAREDASIRLVELTGAGERVFCAGADLTEAPEQTEDVAAARAYDDRWDRVTAALAALPCLTVARINGACIGGGLSFALACDFRIAVESAFFAYPAIKHGVMLSPADARRLAALIGATRAKDMVLLNRRFAAAEALGCGLVDRLGGAGALDREIGAMLAAQAAGEAISILANKRLLDGAVDDPAALEDCYRAVYAKDAAALGRLRRG